MLMHIKRLVRFCHFVRKILSRNEILTSVKSQDIVKNLQKEDRQLFVDIDVHTKFGQILSIPLYDIELKLNSDVNQGP